MIGLAVGVEAQFDQPAAITDGQQQSDAGQQLDETLRQGKT